MKIGMVFSGMETESGRGHYPIILIFIVTWEAGLSPWEGGIEWGREVVEE